MSIARHFALAAVLVVPAVWAAGAEVPVVFWASDPVRPGEVVVVQGGRWGKQPQVEVRRLGETETGGAETLAPLQCRDDSLAFLLPAPWKPGIYRFEIQADGAKSAPVWLNAPAKRFLPMPWEHAICVGGENVQVTDCEVFSSRSPFGLGFGGGLRNSVIRNNRFFEGDSAHVIAGEGIIFEDNVIEGGPTGRGGGDYTSRMYFARNTVGGMSLHDGECFTTDGGGNAPVKLASCEAARLTIETDIDWNRWTDKGRSPARVCIMEGTGAGQTRLIVSHNGREAQLDRPWALPPDANSVLHVMPERFCQNLLIGNRFHDTTVVQSYAWAIDWILAGNHFSRAGGSPSGRSVARSRTPP